MMTPSGFMVTPGIIRVPVDEFGDDPGTVVNSGNEVMAGELVLPLIIASTVRLTSLRHLETPPYKLPI